MRKNNLRRNIGALLIAFIIMFTGLIIYLVYVNAVFGEKWFATPYNPRIQNMKTNVQAGNISDREGQKLLFTDKGKRVYINDKAKRASVAHVVGDEYGLSYGAQMLYAKYLYGSGTDTIAQITQLLSGGEKKGGDVTLTINADLCESAMSALGGSDGAIVVMNYKTGEILASVSSPSFDPADMARFKEGGGTSELVNRAFSGLYPPGSIFKLITAAAMIENGKADFRAICKGSTVIGGQEIACTGVHGDLGLEGALAHSCNVYFAQAANELGGDAIKTEADKFLFNRPLQFGDLMMQNSIFEAGNKETNTAWAAIGQYHDLITPLHACMIAACLANDGVMMEPKLLLSVTNEAGQIYKLSPKAAAAPLSDTDALKAMMVSVVKSGTGTAAAIKGYTVGGKTGTAQVDIGGGETASDAWFVGFIEDEGHPFAIAVIMEKAGSGGSKAAPAAQKVLKKAISLGD